MLHRQSASSPPGSDGFHQFAFRQSKGILAKPDLSSFTGINRMFQSPHPAGRKITMGFSWMQRLGKGASMDLWFPNALKNEVNSLLDSGVTLDHQHFPAEWAAIRQFELLQDAANYKVYNMQADYLMRSLYELSRNMRGGGYRVTLVTLGSYSADTERDELEILDKRLQERLSNIVRMFYLDEQSAEINSDNDEALAAGLWTLQEALPHVSMTLGARDLFKPVGGGVRPHVQTIIVPPAPHHVTIDGWVAHLNVCDTATGVALSYVGGQPSQNEFTFKNGTYTFAPSDEGRTLDIHFMSQNIDSPEKRTLSEKRHRLAQQFFKMLSLLPQNHVVHDTAVGLQLPEMINEEEWIYIPDSDESVHAFNSLLYDVFRPLDVMSLSKLDGREGATSEIKSTHQHMRGYGDRLTPESKAFQCQLAALVS